MGERLSKIVLRIASRDKSETCNSSSVKLMEINFKGATLKGINNFEVALPWA